MPIYCNIDGASKIIAPPAINIDGVWRNGPNIFSNIDGVWRNGDSISINIYFCGELYTTLTTTKGNSIQLPNTINGYTIYGYRVKFNPSWKTCLCPKYIAGNSIYFDSDTDLTALVLIPDYQNSYDWYYTNDLGAVMLGICSSQTVKFTSSSATTLRPDLKYVGNSNACNICIDYYNGLGGRTSKDNYLAGTISPSGLNYSITVPSGGYAVILMYNNINGMKMTASYKGILKSYV